MKMIKFMAFLLLGGLVFTSCKDDNEDENNGGSTWMVTFEGEYFDKLVDSPQYGGALIYSADDYVWTDAESKLSSYCEKADWTMWEMGWGWNKGIAISNYVDDSETASYTEQLSVPVSNGSNNFAVVFDNDCELKFADEVCHVIESMEASMTTYASNNVKKNLGSDYFFKVVATGYGLDGQEKSVDIFFAKGETMTNGWQTVSLKELGAVNRVVFTFEGSDASEWGLNTPKYFALDNIVIKK